MRGLAFVALGAASVALVTGCSGNKGEVGRAVPAPPDNACLAATNDCIRNSANSEQAGQCRVAQSLCEAMAARASEEAPTVPAAPEPGGPPSLPPMPPDAPGADETLTADEADPVVVDCAVNDEKIRERVGATLKKVVVTQSARWGKVYRSDTAVPSPSNGPTSLWRTVCWKEGASLRPLEMNNAGESISPL